MTSTPISLIDSIVRKWNQLIRAPAQRTTECQTKSEYLTIIRVWFLVYEIELDKSCHTLEGTGLKRQEDLIWCGENCSCYTSLLKYFFTNPLLTLAFPLFRSLSGFLPWNISLCNYCLGLGSNPVSSVYISASYAYDVY